MVAQSEEFKQAVIDSKKLTSKPGNDELLELYALFKVANGEDISKAPKPGMFDLKGKAKYNAWQKVVDDSTSAETAQQKYVQLVESLKASHGFDADKQPEAVGSS
ncbi:putative fatty acid binding protein [Seiridium unicorne]|uniref:Fatty acid binding protein n=1 Tax=Seiridium unicorne TaxID=138068 RepID=A0ABR2UIA2_9PEZI